MHTIENRAKMQTKRYGPLKDQVADLYLPDEAMPPVVCLLHGGFWRMPHGREQMTAIAQDLVDRGFAVWNLEYRRLGFPGGGWPGTCNDVLQGIEFLAELATDGIDLDLGRVAVIGHSAGGHLALWSAAPQRECVERQARRCVQVKAVVAEAPVADLRHAYELGIGDGAVAEFLGAPPDEQPDLYRAASASELLPLGVPQLVIQGIADEIVPIEIARTYANAAKDVSDPIELLELPDAEHMDFLDPSSTAHKAACDWLTRILKQP